jgi:hypothetical protein
MRRVGRILRRLQLRFPPFDRGDRSVDGERRVENNDAMAAGRGHGLDSSGASPFAGYPPGFVKDQDDRARH